MTIEAEMATPLVASARVKKMIAVPSLNRLSASMITWRRRGASSCRKSATTATGSVVDMSAANTTAPARLGIDQGGTSNASSIGDSANAVMTIAATTPGTASDASVTPSWRTSSISRSNAASKTKRGQNEAEHQLARQRRRREQVRGAKAQSGHDQRDRVGHAKPFRDERDDRRDEEQENERRGPVHRLERKTRRTSPRHHGRELIGGPIVTTVAGTSDFLALVRQRERGKLKVYIGSAAGTGKTYRMLQEAHDLKRRDVDVVVGFAETHGRTETAAQLGDLEVVARRRIEYRGVTLEEMDVDAVIARRPQVALVDELAHTNVPGARNGKRWQDVLLLLDEGINVITAVNVQHIESLNDVLERELGVTIRETVPDWVVGQADQVVNLDISAEDLRQRLREGKIYHADKIQTALANFFTDENLTTLRELALRETASSVDRSREEIVRRQESGGVATARRTVDRVMVCLSSDPPLSRALLRKGSRIAGRLNSDWFCVYVQTPDERPDRIDSTLQRHLVDNIQLAQSLGAEVVKLDGHDVAPALVRFAAERGVTMAVVGATRRSRWYRLRRGSIVERLMAPHTGLDVLVVSADEVEMRTTRERRLDLGSDE